jgi:uncharacterized protein YqgC (DUF456 family)
MDELLIILGFICVIAGIVGCILPILPGPALCYAGLVLLQFTSGHPFSMQFLVIYALLTAGMAVLDYVIPIYGTKKLEGSKYGIWGSGIGLAAGIVLMFPVGIIVGPIVGAFIGELSSGKKAGQAFKPALGSFLGFLAGTAIKFMLSLSMAYYFILTVYTVYNS